MKKLNNYILCSISIVLFFAILEILYRLIDPFPYYNRATRQKSEDAKLTSFDKILGYKGKPYARGTLITINSKYHVKHNSDGYRDIEHNKNSNKKKIIFLGDSFTWGFEVEESEMFVSYLRNKLKNKNIEIINISYRGWGTDQEYLALKAYLNNKKLANILCIVLMFYKNDLLENTLSFAYKCPKPLFEVKNNKLFLKKLPEKKANSLTYRSKKKEIQLTFVEKLASFIYSSHFLHDIHLRLKSFFNKKNHVIKVYIPPVNLTQALLKKSLPVTEKLILKLKSLAEKHNASFCVITIPAKYDIRYKPANPYSFHIKRICQKYKIKFFDLFPYFKNSFFRTHHRYGNHFTGYGHKLAAKLILNYLKQNFLINKK